MKSITLLLVALANSLLLLGQPTSEISLGYTRYMNHYTDYKRTNGVTIGYSLEWQVQEKLAVNVGVKLEVVKEQYAEYLTRLIYTQDSIYIDYNYRYIYNYNYLSSNFHLPVYFVFDIYKSEFFIFTGVELNIENIAFLSGIKPYTDINNLYYSYFNTNWPPKSRNLGFGYQIGIMYRPTHRIGITCEARTIKNVSFSFNNFELGLNYRFIKDQRNDFIINKNN